MEKKILYAIIASVAIAMSGIALRMFAGQTLLRVLLVYASFFVFGLIISNMKKALILGLVLNLAYQFIVALLFTHTETLPKLITLPDFWIGVLISVAISLALSLAGAFIGSKVLSRFSSSR